MARRKQSVFDNEYKRVPEVWDDSLFELREYNGKSYLWYKGNDDELWLPDGCESIYRMFAGSAHIPKILHNTENVKEATHAFYHHQSITAVDLKTLSSEEISLKRTIDISDWSLPSVEIINGMFSFSDVASVKLSNKWPVLVAAQKVFEYCNNISDINIDFGGCKLEYLDAFCNNCCSLENLIIAGNSEKLPWLSGSVKGCKSLLNFDISAYSFNKKDSANHADSFGFEECPVNIEVIITKKQESIFANRMFNYYVKVVANSRESEKLSSF